MNKRLVWNFEIDSTKPLVLAPSCDREASDMHWELRYFWPENHIIQLHGLSSDFLDLTRYRIKHRQDIYYLLPEDSYNLKMRKYKIFYKPLLMQQGACYAYGRKIQLEDIDAHTLLPGSHETAGALLQRIKEFGISIPIEKDVLIYHFDLEIPLKMELARLLFNQKTYFSMSLESPNIALLQSLGKQLLGSIDGCDYVHFLQQNKRKGK